MMMNLVEFYLKSNILVIQLNRELESIAKEKERKNRIKITQQYLLIHVFIYNKTSLTNPLLKVKSYKEKNNQQFLDFVHTHNLIANIYLTRT